MQKVAYLLLAVALSLPTFAQKQNIPQSTGVIVSSEFHITKPLTEIAKQFPVNENAVSAEKESKDRENRQGPKYEKNGDNGSAWGNDPRGKQDRMGDVPNNDQRISWAGQTASGFRPFDPSGAVGPTHYVQMINATTFKVYDKSTGSVLLTATLGNLWSPATANNGDPIVLYDKAADRWLLAQFGNTTDKKIYIAISTSGNPTGSYYTYTFVSPQFPDYLKFSVWQDGYYMTSNQTTQKVFAFDRTAMLAGTPGARALYVTYSPPKSGFFVPLAADASDGTLPPAGTPCPIISYSDNGWGSGYIDAVNIYDMSVNWVPTTPTGTITLKANVATQAFDASYNSRWNDCPQPGTKQKLDGIGGVCMYRAQWKSWAGYNTVVLNWAVRINTNQRSIKWCEIRQNQSTTNWSMYQEGIYTPDANTRWMGSICMDNNGSIGLSYIKSNATSIYPGLYYTGRRTCDPLGTLPVTETTVVAGTGSQTGINRVGDYAQTCLDPDGVTFWSTSEYMGGPTGSSAARTYVFSYTINPCAGGLIGDKNDKTQKQLISTENISNVRIGSINNYSNSLDNAGYSDFSRIKTDLIIGSKNDLSIAVENGFVTDKIKVWCDWNNDGQFNNENELTYVSPNGAGPFNTSIYVPKYAEIGEVKMRVQLMDENAEGYGETELYTLNLINASVPNVAVVEERISKHVETNILDILPNPNQGSFVIQSQEDGQYYLIDQNGKYIQSILLNKENNHKALVSNLIPGLYILSGQNAKGITKQKVVVK